MTIYRRTLAGGIVTINASPPEFAIELWRRWLSHVERNEDGVIGFDVETTAIDEILGPFEPGAQMRLAQFGSRRYAWVLDPHDPFWRDKINALLSDPSFRFVSHTNYDVLWAGREFGTPADERFIDTMPMAALLHPGVTEDKSLKALSTELIDPLLREAEGELLVRFKDLYFDRSRLPKSFVAGTSRCRHPKCELISEPDSLRGLCPSHAHDAKIFSEVKRWGFTNIALDDETYNVYAGLDAICVRRVLDILAAKINKTPMVKLSRREQSFQRIATRIRQRGHRVDDEWTRGVLAEVEGEFDAAAAWIEDEIGCRPASPKRVDWLLDRGVRFTGFTKSGTPQLTMPSATAEGTLPDLYERYADDPEIEPALAAMLTIGTHRNLLTNLKIILASAANDGYVHPEIRTQAAHTGRSSIVKPAMQTFKKNDPRLRGCFIARDGKVLVGADYYNQEICIAAAYSQDPALLRIVRERLNQHVLTAEMIFGVDEATARAHPPGGGRSDYDKAKTLDFAQLFGARPKRIAGQLGISVDEATTLYNAWQDAYAGFSAWFKVVANSEYVVNPWGRSIPADPYRPYANANYAIQGTGRDILGDAIMRLDSAGWADTIWLPIHDELVLEVDENQVDDALAVMAETMNTRLRNVALTVEPKVIGTRWGTGD